MNTSVSFEIAKLLKEKNIVIKPNALKTKTDYIEGYDWDIEDETDYLKVIEFQFKDNIRNHLYLKPTIAEVVMWLYKKYGIWVEIRFADDYKIFFYDIINTKNLKAITSKSVSHFNSPTEAHEAAIKYILIKLL